MPWPNPRPHSEPPRTNTTTSQGDDTGYPWLFFYVKRSWLIGLLVTLLVLGLSGAFYLWYSQPGNDASPDSVVGLGYAIAGTTLLVLAAVLYRLRRRSHKRALGQLHAALQWHMFFAIMGLALLMMHSFGNLNPRSGTYVLYSLIALTVSGFVGRALDHFVPRMIADEVTKVLTAQGEDRIETVSQKLQALAVHNAQEMHNLATSPPHSSTALVPYQEQDSAPNSVPGGQFFGAPWDIAYISLDMDLRKVSREATGGGAGAINRAPTSGALMAGAQEQVSVLQEIQRAMEREQSYRYVIRYWRLLHIFLALLTLALTIWHILYALQLLLVTQLG